MLIFIVGSFYASSSTIDKRKLCSNLGGFPDIPMSARRLTFHGELPGCYISQDLFNLYKDSEIKEAQKKYKDLRFFIK